MLYETIARLLIIYVIASPFIMMQCIKFGYRMAAEPEKESARRVMRRKTKSKEMRLSKEEEAERTYWYNVVNFDGTSKGQKPIEE